MNKELHDNEHRALRNALMWAFDYFGIDHLTEKNRVHGVQEIGKALIGRKTRITDYTPNEWDPSAKLR